MKKLEYIEHDNKSKDNIFLYFIINKKYLDTKKSLINEIFGVASFFQYSYFSRP